MDLKKAPRTFYARFGKRALDILFSSLALLILSPVLLVLSILVRVKLGKPVLFAQPRPGRGEKVFKMYKFRTMTDETDENGALLPDAERLTSFGQKLRSLSLDELPELWNIFKGDMSIVGPRPLLVSYLELYNEEQKKRHLVRPGLTGLAQVNGRNATTWSQRFSYDVQYVENVSFCRDVKILISTVRAVLRREGISGEGEATMRPFTGTDVE